MEMTLLELLRKYNPYTFPISNFHVDLLDEEPQDSSINSNKIHSFLGEKNRKNPTEIINVSQASMFSRGNTYFCYFLDGCRKAYYICDMATSNGNMIPILMGQISAAVIERDRTSGKVVLHKHERRGLLMLPTGGNGIPENDAKEIKAKFDESFSSEKITVSFVKVRHQDNPKNDTLAKLNFEMQNLEISFLEQMTSAQALTQDNMIVVDGALQFQNIKQNRIHNLRYAVGISKHFNLHLTNIIGKNKEIGTLLINLKKVGDRTPAYRLKLDNGNQFAFWYLRIRDQKYLNFPFAGIIKLEKVLVTLDEREDGLTTDTVENISRCALQEISVCTHGNDFRWASHIYPIYLSEQIQKKKFINDYYFRYILRRRISI